MNFWKIQSGSSMEGTKAVKFNQKDLHFCSEDEQKWNNMRVLLMSTLEQVDN